MSDRIEDTSHSLSLLFLVLSLKTLPFVFLHWARGKRRGFSPGAAARHKGRTRVPTEYSRPLSPPFFSLCLRSDVSSFRDRTLNYVRSQIGRLRRPISREMEKKGQSGGSGPTPVARGGSGPTAPPLATRSRAPTGKQHTFIAEAAAYTAKHCNILLQTATRCLTLQHSPI